MADDKKIKELESLIAKLEKLTKTKYDLNIDTSNIKQVNSQINVLNRAIKDAEKEKVFTKFYRVGSEETRNSKGTGLGLYIVKNLVKMCEGKIEIKNNSPQGSNFCITFNAV